MDYINLLESDDNQIAEYLNILDEFGYVSTMNEATRMPNVDSATMIFKKSWIII